MMPTKENIKNKINQLDDEIKLLENKINEISWQRTKYRQFYEKYTASKNDS